MVRLVASNASLDDHCTHTQIQLACVYAHFVLPTWQRRRPVCRAEIEIFISLFLLPFAVASL